MVESKTTKRKYIEAVGRRKTSTARVRLTPTTKTIVTINGRTIETYIPLTLLRDRALEPLNKMKIKEKFSVTIVATGGGISSQADAIRHGLARALLLYDKNLKTDLRKGKMLTRDGRTKERRKFGLKKARKAPQWSKR